jgi:hypothetical protein
MWRQHYRFRLCEHSGYLLVVAQLPGGEPFLLPPVGAKAGGVVRELLARPEAARLISRVSEGYLARHGLSDLLAGERTEAEAAEERDQADYVYLVDDLIRLEGNRYGGKRNHLKRFRKLYRWEYRELTADLVPECLKLEEDWCRVRVCPRQLGLEAERVAIWEALENIGRLGYAGGAILVEGRLEAFSLGEGLNEECAVIHIEKANPEMEGIYPAINQLFLERALASYRFINREQDLGDAGLRKSKMSYHPRHLVRKFSLRAK